MSIQDDIFDIEFSLKEKPQDLKTFERLCEYLYELEITVESQQKTLSNIRNGALALKELWK